MFWEIKDSEFLMRFIIVQLGLDMASKDYLQMFNRFFSKEGRMSSTYKPVFLRAILDIGDLYDSETAQKLIGSQWLERRDGKVFVDLNFVAARFAKYYWDMEYSFHLRQSQDPQDANITRLIRSVHDPKKKPPTIEELSSDDMERFRTNVITKSIKREVLVHLLTDMEGFYKKTGSKTIALDEDVIGFLHAHKILLKKGLNSSLAKYLEKLNRMTPQIANKIDNEFRNRTSLKEDIHLLMNKQQDSQCFYCKHKFQSPHVDHVIPYNYIFSTDPYNCVLSCQQCNCTKSDMLPHEDLFSSVIERNREITDYLNTVNSQYNEKSYRRLFDMCAEEYNTGRYFQPDV